MSLFPKTCPHCDAGPGRYVNIYLCGTYLRAGEDDRKLQTKRCTARERTRLAARVAELEAENKQARDDEAWAHDKIMPVDFAPVESGWEAGWWDGEKRISATAPTIHAALRALRQKVEGGTR